MKRIRITPGLPVEVFDAINPHLQRWALLVPSWCREVNILWDDADDNGALCIKVHYEYRRADLTVLPNFLSMSEPGRREVAVIHELLHIVTEPMINTARDLRDTLVKAHPEMETWADEMIRHSNESVTCDLTEMVHGHMAEAK